MYRKAAKAMIINRERALHSFDAYVSNYNKSDEKIKLKIEHTYRVCELCEQIAKDLGWSEAEVETAWLTGLLHDVGRFEQLRQYNTFSDADSVDHAELGAHILFDEGRVRDYIDDDSQDEFLKNVIINHSVYRIPESLTEDEKRFCNLLRDADKIDILKVNIIVPLEEIYNTTKEELYNAAVTPEVLNSFYEEHAVLRSLKKTPVDNVVGHISLVYELVYPVSLEIVKKQGFLMQMCRFESNNPQTRETFKKIEQHMQEYLMKNNL